MATSIPGVLNVTPPTQVINSRRNATTGTQTTLCYPRDIGPHYLYFNIKSYDRFPTAQQQVTSKSIASFALPVPSNFGEQMAASYDGAAMDFAGVAFQDIMRGNFNSLSAIKNDLLSSKGSDFISGAAAKAVGTSFPLGVGQTVKAAAGVILNPDRTLLFNGVPLRGHEWRWLFAPENSTESEDLGRIMQLIKQYMLPNLTTLSTSLEYPCTFDISLAGQSTDTNYKFQFKTAVCVKANFGRTYGDQPTFFKGSGAPTIIPMDLEFRELESFVRADINAAAVTDNNLAGAAANALNIPSLSSIATNYFTAL